MRARNLVSIGVGLTLILTACSTEPTETSKVTARPPSQAAQDLPADSSAADRIDAALAAGEIDESVAAMYRVWAKFGDPELPSEFQSETSGIDTFTIASIGASLSEYSEEARAEIEPFFVRPSDPGSAFSDPDASIADAAAPDRGNTMTLAALEARSPATVQPADNANNDEVSKPKRCNNWETEVVPDLPFRVWACADALDAPAVIATLSDILQRHAPDMIAEFPNGMGAPIPDAPDSDGPYADDDRIDFYILPTGWMAPKRGLNERVADETLAGVAMPAAPMDQHTSSSYLLIASYLFEHPEALERVTVHELFHALQYSHYRDISLENRWLFEGSGFWSEQYFTDQEPTHTYFYRIGEMQNSAMGLADTDFQHSYSTFIWFTFLQQQHGPEAVFAFWKALGENLPPADDPLPVGALGSQFSLDEEFAEFGLRLLNVQLAGNPISPRFADFDSNFPDDSVPDLAPVDFDGSELTLDGQGIPELGYRYTLVSFADETSLNLSHNLTTASGAQPVVEALIPDSDGTYERVRLGTDEQAFCISGDAYFVLSNPSVVLGDESSGLITLAPDEGQGCGDASQVPGDLPPKPAESDYCPDMTWFDEQLHDLMNNPRGVSAQYVDEVFAVAEPYLLDLPDGGQEHIANLRQHVDKFIDVDDGEAHTLAADPEFQNWVEHFTFLIRYC
ncbi:MAG TPA: hypothetical protein VK030_07735 [Actinomycetales bacterium]|nr:hypothetical protein [Actinomycetales bacterium]